MDKPSKKPKFKKILLISLGSVLTLLLLVVSVGYLVLRGFIRKMNLVDLESIEEENNAYIADYDEDFSDGDYMFYEEYDETLDSFSVNNTNSGNEDDEDISILSVNDKVTDIPIMDDKDVINILLIGSDSRDPKVRGRSDAILIMSVNKKKEKIVLTSLLRDIYLDIPGKSSNRINAAYAMGGAKLLIETIEHNFRINIDKYISVDFYAFMDIIDALGGVTIEVSEEEVPYINSSVREINNLLKEDSSKDIITTSGKLLLNGKQTLGFSRIRYLGTDFARTARQREVLEQVFYKLKKSRISNIVNILNVVLPKVTTNFTENEIISHILNIPDYLGYDFEQLRIPLNGSYKNANIKKMAVLVIDFEENIKELQNMIYLTD